MKYHIKNVKLANEGEKRIEWARLNMPVVCDIEKRFRKTKPLKGIRISACLHVTTETANLMRCLKAGGADAVLCASNPLSTQDDVAAALVKKYGISVFSICGENNKTYYQHLRSALAHNPHITMDDGADLVSEIHKRDDPAFIKNIIGGTEETTTGVIRLKAMAKEGILKFPILAVNDAATKHFFDNRYGTGQSTLDGIIRSTNVLLAGMNVVICGYGWCGRGVAVRARGMGSHVTVVEVDPIRSLEAVMDGFRVEPLMKAARTGQLFITVTGDIHVIRKEHFAVMREGAIVANSGHFNVELDLDGLKKITRSSKTVRPMVEAYKLKNGRTIHVLAEGRLINLAAAEGHPAMVMDMSFANQALSAEFMVKKSSKLKKEVYVIPPEIDRNIARLKLKTMGIRIDRLTAEQDKYLHSWEAGT